MNLENSQRRQKVLNPLITSILIANLACAPQKRVIETSCQLPPLTGFSIAHQNAPLECANVVLLAQEHWNWDNLAAIQEFVNHNALPGDILLIEMSPYGIRLKPNLFDDQIDHITQAVQISGWEDPVALQESEEFLRTYFNLTGDVYDLVPSLPDPRNEVLRQVEIDDMRRLLVQKGIRNRDIGLVCSLEGAVQHNQGKRVFVIAGGAHLEGEAVREALERYSYVVLKPR